MTESYRILVSHDTPRASGGVNVLGRHIADALGREYNAYYLNWRSYGQPCEVQYRIGRRWFRYYELTNPSGHEYASVDLAWYLQEINPDVFLTIGDLQTFKHLFYVEGGKVRSVHLPRGVLWVCYAAVDAAPLLPVYAELYKSIPFLVVYTEWARKVLAEANVKDNVNMIPHGVDTKLFHPLSKRRRELIRKELGFHKKFVIGGVSMNIIRKRWDLWLRVIEKVRRKVTNAYGWFHSQSMAADTWAPNVPRMAEKLQLYGSFGGPKSQTTTVRADWLTMPEIYSALDVHMLCTSHGAWELPTLEAMACGTPAAITDYGAMGEVVKGRGVALPVARIMDNSAGLDCAEVDVDAAAEEIIYLAENPKYREELRLRGLSCAASLDWDKVCREKWVPYMRGILPKLPDRWEAVLADLRRKGE